MPGICSKRALVQYCGFLEPHKYKKKMVFEGRNQSRSGCTDKKLAFKFVWPCVISSKGEREREGGRGRGGEVTQWAGIEENREESYESLISYYSYVYQLFRYLVIVIYRCWMVVFRGGNFVNIQFTMVLRPLSLRRNTMLSLMTALLEHLSRWWRILIAKRNRYICTCNFISDLCTYMLCLSTDIVYVHVLLYNGRLLWVQFLRM